MNLPSEKELREAAIFCARSVLKSGHQAVEGEEFTDYLEPIIPIWKDPTNRTRFLDKLARSVYVGLLKERFGDSIVIYGEEEKKKPGKDFRNINKVVAFVDPVDGTDLAARGFSNWVSTAIFLIPKQKRIISAVVGHSCGDIFYANEKGAYLRPRKAGDKKNHDKRLRCDSNREIALCNAAICYYGQKPKSFLELAKHSGFLKVMEGFKERMTTKKNAVGKTVKKKEGLDIRIYNFGGNPMMVKIPCGAVDAVFSLKGAKIYDVLPGAYIAAKAGALFTDISGNPIDPITPLLTPNDPVPYIVSGSKTLKNELVAVLKSSA